MIHLFIQFHFPYIYFSSARNNFSFFVVKIWIQKIYIYIYMYMRMLCSCPTHIFSVELAIISLLYKEPCYLGPCGTAFFLFLFHCIGKLWLQLQT